LFYVEILANNFIFEVIEGGGISFKKSLSTAIVYG